MAQSENGSHRGSETNAGATETLEILEAGSRAGKSRTGAGQGRGGAGDERGKGGAEGRAREVSNLRVFSEESWEGDAVLLR